MLAAGSRELPFVEKERNATRGRTPVNCRQTLPVSTPMDASCSTVGSGTTAQSANISIPSAPKRSVPPSSIMQLETGGDPRQRLDDLDQRAHQGAGVLARATHQPVRLPVLDHHRREVIRVQQNLPRIPGPDVPVALERLEAFREDRQVVRLRGIDDADTRQVDPILAPPCA